MSAVMVAQVVVASYTVSVIAVVLFGVFACVYTFLRHRKYGSDTTEFFLTARRSVVRLHFQIWALLLSSPRLGLSFLFESFVAMQGCFPLRLLPACLPTSPPACHTLHAACDS